MDCFNKKKKAIIEGTNICGECAPECATCSLAYKSKSCLRCANDYYLDDEGIMCLQCAAKYAVHPESKLCVLICPDGYYNNVTTRECTTCDSTCSKCVGGLNTECTGCFELHTLVDGQCVSDDLKRACDTKEFVYFVSTSV